MEKLFTEINKRNVHYGTYVEQIRDMFARKQESIVKKDDKFFSKYWQVYAWSAIIGFVNDKREIGADLPNQSSFQYQMITNGSESIAHALLLMAIGKIDAKESSDFLNSRKLLTTISEFAEGGAKHILEIRQTPGWERKFDSPDDYLIEIVRR
ncbi:hypothetical protein [Chryseobacterium caseinilyticum]|uniref:Dnd system-associated protein 4 n=1 Tax=Chryseobacterium caseinilyticum TaxID=2771428 RepID=A0ABR8ZCM9_9FLAO|nr:hypothetical protein [Chryseobacterium caseinilyticum]MBD8083013.1 hypothetical protein [Chryseobacterium caseinilyticum]